MNHLKSTGSALDLRVQQLLPKLKAIPRYYVILVNDDYTPMDFVVEVLEQLFYKDHPTATQLMLQVHQQGQAICGTYPLEIAETKVAQVHEYATLHEHPLLCKLQPAD